MAFGEKYLRHPDLCPRRLSGEPWGTEDLALELGNDTYRVGGLTATQAASLARRFGGWLRSGNDSSPAVRITVYRMPETDFRPIDTRGWEYELDFDHGRDIVRVAGLDFVGIVDRRSDEASAGFWTFQEGDDLFGGAAENLLRLLVAQRTLNRGGLLLHGAGVVREGSAIVAFGHSGAGKTTFSRLCVEAGLGVISDDLIALVPGSNGFEVLCLPFTGDLKADIDRRGSVRLGRLLRLRKGEDDAVAPMGDAAAVASLMACAPGINRDHHCADRLEAIAQRIVLSFHPEELVFCRDRLPRAILDS